MASITRVEVGGGWSHGAGAIRGAKIGALAMGGFCLVVSASAYLADSGKKDVESLAGFVGLFAYSGAFYGAIIGAIVGKERYTMAYPDRVALKMNPRTHGTRQIGLALRF